MCFWTEEGGFGQIWTCQEQLGSQIFKSRSIIMQRKLDNNWFWKVLLRSLLEEAKVLNTDLRVAIISFYESWKGLKLRIGIDQTQIQTREQKISE